MFKNSFCSLFFSFLFLLILFSGCGEKVEENVVPAEVQQLEEAVSQLENLSKIVETVTSLKEEAEKIEEAETN